MLKVVKLPRLVVKGYVQFGKAHSYIVLPYWEWFLACSVPKAMSRYHPREHKSQLHFI